MKIWIETDIITTAEGKKAVDANGLSAPWIPISETRCIARVAGLPDEIAILVSTTGNELTTDTIALAAIQAIESSSGLENVDASDPEVDEIAKLLGLDPHLRADIQIPSQGKQVLQDQENCLLALISAKKGKSKQFWDDETKKSGKWAKGIDIENDVLDGKGAAHEFILSRLR